jgi:hypothetical protein
MLGESEEHYEALYHYSVCHGQDSYRVPPGYDVGTPPVLVLRTLRLYYYTDLITHFQLMYLHISKRNDTYRYEEVRNWQLL